MNKRTGNLKQFERILSRDELEGMIRGRHIVIYLMRHKLKSYELRGYLRRIG